MYCAQLLLTIAKMVKEYFCQLIIFITFFLIIYKLIKGLNDRISVF
jgi:hypothetical protein